MFEFWLGEGDRDSVRVWSSVRDGEVMRLGAGVGGCDRR